MPQGQVHTHSSSDATSGDAELLIDIRGLYKSFGENHVLRGFDLKLFDGENVVIIGKSGSGKSILLKCIIGLMLPDAGQLLVMGESVPEMDRNALNRMRLEVGFLFQGSALYDSMTVRENLEFPLRRHPQKIGEEPVEELVRSALRDVGLEDAIDLMPAELSGGMKRRVALTRTLILKPRIILYDEPTSGLDPITSAEITRLIRNVQDRYQTSSLIITHDMDVARIIASRVIVLVDGVAHAMGAFEDLERSEDPKVQAFFI
jgi:phospholipid/cholesterol/gamma-HCH transport system ATP-binding protein